MAQRAQQAPEPDPAQASTDPEPVVESREYRYSAKATLDRTMGPKLWIESPGTVLLPKVPMSLLCASHNYMTGDNVKHVDHCKAILLKANLYLVPTFKDDPEAANVSWSGRGARINLSTLFVEAKREIETGWKELFPCSFEKQTPYGPAVVVDLTKAEKRKAKSSKSNQKKNSA